MILKSDLMLRIIDLECIVEELDERLDYLERKQFKKELKKGKNETTKS